MDPQATWDEILSTPAIPENYERLIELCDSLQEWLDRGGYVPVVEHKNYSKVYFTVSRDAVRVALFAILSIIPGASSR